MAREASSQDAEDEVMTNDGETITKFSKGALEIEAAVSAVILDKVREVFDLNKGDDRVFRTQDGAPSP